MRIVYLLRSLSIAGAERQALDLAERMRERGHSVAVFTLMPKLPDEWPTSLPVFKLGLGRNPLSYLHAFVRARRYLRDLGPNIVHSYGDQANIFARLLRSFLRTAMVVSTIHNVYAGGWLRMRIYRLTDSLSARTVAVSQVVADRFIACRAVAANKCSVIVNGIDLDRFTPDSEQRTKTRDALGAGSNFVWLAVGRLTGAKDYPNLLRAFAELRASFSAVRLWIAGEGSTAETADLHALAEQFNLAGTVLWLGVRRDVPALLDAADAFVMSSAWEGVPLALGEAMAMQKPTIATDVGGVRELTGDTVSVVRAKSAEHLAEAMLALMQKPPAVREALGLAARERIARYSSIDARADEWESLYWKLFRQPT